EAASSGTVTPMIGRDLEFAVLMHTWQRAKSGKGQMVLLCGEPGIGKSRLMHALRDSLSEERTAVWQYQCSPYFVNSALYPFIDNLTRTLMFGREEPAHSRLDKLQRLLTALGRPHLDIALIGRLLSLPTQVRFGELKLTPQKQKDETLRALRDLLS